MFLKDLIEDARSIRDRDPAARTTAEVFLLYPGFHALIYHKLTHWLYLHKRFFLARMISQFARTMTGVGDSPGGNDPGAVCSLTTAWALSSVRLPRSGITAPSTMV